jgi:hypothetical protein
VEFDFGPIMATSGQKARIRAGWELVFPILVEFRTGYRLQGLLKQVSDTVLITFYSHFYFQTPRDPGTIASGQK